MSVHRVLGVAILIAALSSCGDPNAVGSPGDTLAPGGDATPSGTAQFAAGSNLQTCTAAPFLGAPEGAPPEAGTQAAELASAHSDVFAGVWWDGRAAEFVFASVDIDRARALVAEQLPAELRYRIEAVARSASQLDALQQRAIGLQQQQIADSTSQRVWDAVLEINLRIMDQPSVQAVETVFADSLDSVCVTGADPATVPVDGPQPTSGDGWRLLADADRHGEPYAVHTAVNQAEYESLWASLSLDGTPPTVDFTGEIVVHFGAVYGSSCPEIRLDGVDFDTAQSVVSPHVVLRGGNRDCTADALPRAYVVAVDRAHLPALPFTLRVSDCGGCQQDLVTDLTGTTSPDLSLSASDRSQIFAAVAVARLAADSASNGAVDVVRVLGRGTGDGFVDFGAPGAELTDAERAGIEAALAGRSVRFTDVPNFDELLSTEHPPGYAVLSLAEPVIVAGQITVTSMSWCGGTCGTSGAFAVEIGDDGLWHVTGQVGPQSMA